MGEAMVTGQNSAVDSVEANVDCKEEFAAGFSYGSQAKEATIATQKTKMSELQAEAEDAERKLAQAIKAKKQLQADLEAGVSSAEKAASLKKQRAEEHKAQLEQLKKNHATQQEILQAKQKAAISELQADVADTEQKLAQAIKAKDQVQSTLQTKDATIATQKAAISKLQAKAKDAQQKLDEAIKAKEQLRGQLDAKKEKLQGIQDDAQPTPIKQGCSKKCLACSLMEPTKCWDEKFKDNGGIPMTKVIAPKGGHRFESEIVTTVGQTGKEGHEKAKQFLISVKYVKCTKCTHTSCRNWSNGVQPEYKCTSRRASTCVTCPQWTTFNEVTLMEKGCKRECETAHYHLPQA